MQKQQIEKHLTGSHHLNETTVIDHYHCAMHDNTRFTFVALFYTKSSRLS